MSMLSSNSSCTPKDIKNQSDLVKFDVQTGFEEFLAGLRNLSVVLAILLPIDWILEGTQPIPLQLGLGTVLVAAGFVVLSLGTDSHYLVDPKAHVIYSVFVVFGRRRMRLAVQKTAHLVQSKYSSFKVRLGNHMSYARFLGMKFTQGSVILPRGGRERA